MLRLLRQAVNPTLGVGACISGWFGISMSLREAPRERRLQADEIVNRR